MMVKDSSRYLNPLKRYALKQMIIVRPTLIWRHPRRHLVTRLARPVQPGDAAVQSHQGINKRKAFTRRARQQCIETKANSQWNRTRHPRRPCRDAVSSGPCYRARDTGRQPWLQQNAPGCTVNASVRTNNLSLRHRHRWHPSYNHRRLRRGKTSRRPSPSTRTDDRRGRTSGRAQTRASRQCSRMGMLAQFATDCGTARTWRVCRLSHSGTTASAVADDINHILGLLEVQAFNFHRHDAAARGSERIRVPGRARRCIVYRSVESVYLLFICFLPLILWLGNKCVSCNWFSDLRFNLLHSIHAFHFTTLGTWTLSGLKLAAISYTQPTRYFSFFFLRFFWVL
jgi:hypothetical protein